MDHAARLQSPADQDSSRGAIGFGLWLVVRANEQPARTVPVRPADLRGDIACSAAKDHAFPARRRARYAQPKAAARYVDHRSARDGAVGAHQPQELIGGIARCSGQVEALEARALAGLVLSRSRSEFVVHDTAPSELAHGERRPEYRIGAATFKDADFAVPFPVTSPRSASMPAYGKRWRRCARPPLRDTPRTSLFSVHSPVMMAAFGSAKGPPRQLGQPP